MMDEVESLTPRHQERAEEVTEIKVDGTVLDQKIAQLQRDLKSITSKIEDYNFSQNKLERELGYTVKKDADARAKACWKRRESVAMESAKSPSLPLLGPGMTLTAGGVDEADAYRRQNTAVENAYTRQSTILTNDTLLTESVVEGAEAHRQKNADNKLLKVQS